MNGRSPRGYVHPTGFSALDRPREDLIRVLKEVPGAGLVIGACVALLDAQARAVHSATVGPLMKVAASRAAGLLAETAERAGVPPVAPTGPVHDDSDLDRVSLRRIREDTRAAIASERMPAGPLRRGVRKLAAQQGGHHQEGTSSL